MKIYLTKTLYLILILLFACDSTKKELPSEFANTELQLIGFLEKKIYLPKNYRKITFEEYSEVLNQMPDKDVSLQLQYENFNNLKNKGAKFEIFVDERNIQNYISFMLGEYIVLDKSNVNLYVNMLEEQVFSKLADYGIEYTRLENKFISLKNTKAIKVKYEEELNGIKSYITQYIITYKFQTFSINVTNEKGNDYQFILKNFSSY